VAKDNTVHDHLQRLQIPRDPHRFHDAKGTELEHAYPNGTLAVFYGPRCLARSRSRATAWANPRPGSQRLARPAARSSIVDHI
jgi:hypothetical protein